MFDNFYLNIELIDENAKLPTRAYNSDAGLDVYSPIDKIIFSKQDVLIPLGFKTEFTKNYVLLATNKSGRSIDNKLLVGAGIIDSDYRGIVHAHIFNLGSDTVFIKKHEKIMQLLIIPCWTGNPTLVNKIENDTLRGTGMRSSTGLQWEEK